MSLEFFIGLLPKPKAGEDFLKNFFIDVLKAKMTAQSNQAKMAKLAVLYG